MNGEPLRSRCLAQIPGIVYGFGDRRSPFPPEVGTLSTWQRAKPNFKQVHGVACGEYRATGEELGEIDALVTSQPEATVAIATADCVPILIAHESGTRVAAVHAGWRGTRARILEKIWPQLTEALPPAARDPRQWVAAIGPAIGPCCYQVSEELADGFRNEFGSFLASHQITPAPRMLDLPAINAAILSHSLGLERVDLLRACTHCACDSAEPDQPAYHSYRREGGGTRQYSAIRTSRD